MDFAAGSLDLLLDIGSYWLEERQDRHSGNQYGLAPCTVAKLDSGFAEANLAEHTDLGAAADKALVPPALGADLGLKPVDTLAEVLGPRMVLGNQLGWTMGPQFDKTVLAHLFELQVAGKACFAVAAAAKVDIVAAVVVAEASVVEMEKRTVAAAVEAVVVVQASVAAAAVVVAVGDAVVAAAAVVVAGEDAVETAVVAAFEVVTANTAAVGAAMEYSVVVVVVVGFPSLAAEVVASNSEICKGM